MPIFEYSCEDCGTHFEKLVRRVTDDVTCPSCESGHLKQELSTFAAHAGTASKGAPAQMPSCPGGMCQNPGMCGRN
ncbi:MAG: zinc ribbon domain-containing protein [Bryobacterales bacterium]|nr:zinc ribbon domain-containing protein [Bryobacterales bacterium]